METKTCKVCGRELPIERFSRNRQGVLSLCKECQSKRLVQGHAKGKSSKREPEGLELAPTNYRNLRLADFTPRELMEELVRRGYTGKLQYVEVRTIDLEKF